MSYLTKLKKEEYVNSSELFSNVRALFNPYVIEEIIEDKATIKLLVNLLQELKARATNCEMGKTKSF